MKVYEFECPITNKIYTVRAGESAQDNWDIIAESDSSDIWFHVDKFPSSHVILNTDGEILKKIHKSVIRYCASLCKDGSKRKNIKKVGIIFTEVDNVIINKNGDVGSVFTRKTRKIVI
jgi:predicted ribosome quality control (RQC) complex YloA/Tae2 family protein